MLMYRFAINTAERLSEPLPSCSSAVLWSAPIMAVA